MDEGRTLFFLKLARVAGIWGLIYLGMGIGISICELLLFNVTGQIGPFSIFALGAFMFSLANYQVSQWAKKKVGILDEEGRQGKIRELTGRE